MRLSELYAYINVAIFIALFVLAWLQYRKKPVTKNRPNLSFIIPCYNDWSSVWDSIKSIFDSYDHDKIELVVVDDASTDDSYEVMRSLQDDYNFKLIKNEKNLGKVDTLNKYIPNLKCDIFIIIDADTKLNKNAIDDIIARFDKDTSISWVSCYYKPANKWFIPILQYIEYTSAKVIRRASNFFVWCGLVWWCMAIKKDDFIRLGWFKKNALGEDFDFACRLIVDGKKIEHSRYDVESVLPDTVSWWFKQKLRRHGWFVQAIMLNPKVLIKNLFFTFATISILWINMNYMHRFYIWFVQESISAKISLISGWVWVASLVNYDPFKKFLLGDLRYYVYNLFDLSSFTFDSMSIIKLIFILAVMVYTLPLIRNWKQIWKIIYIVPYIAIYMPIYGLMCGVGYFYGVYKYFNLKSSDRGW